MIFALPHLALVFLGWLGCYRLCRELSARGRIDPDRRMSLLLGSVAWGTLVAFITELCSLGTWLNRPALAVAWLLADFALWTGCFWLARSREARSQVTSPGLLGGRTSLATMASWPLDIRLMWTGVTLLVVFLGAVALLTPTTNWDSLTYHLPRVMHWVQQQSVQHYPTGSIGQLQMGPWTAFVQIHFFLLWGNDLFANLVQWSAMLGCVIAATFIAKQLSRANDVESRRTQALAALLVATLPAGIVESITPQTDYVAAFWFAGLMSSALALLRDPTNIWYLSAAGLACGLGLLTKITFVLYVAPLGFVVGLWLLWRWRAPLQITGRTILFAAIVSTLFLPHALRNRAVFGSPVSAQSTQQYGQNKRFSVTATLSNMIRNAALHTNTGIQPLTRLANETLNALHALTGRELNDPDTTFPPSPFKFQEKFVIGDSETGNPYHLALLLAALIMLLCRPRTNRHLLSYAVVLVAGYALSCTVLRWQQWNARYHLPYFVLFMPMVAIVIASRSSRWLAAGIAAGLTFFAAVVIAANQSRPVFHPAYLAQPRFRKMLFEQGPLFAEQLETMARDIVKSGCVRAGLKLNSDDAEYPLWVALRNHGFTGRLDHVYVENESASVPAPASRPCVLIAMSTNVPSIAIKQEFPYRMEYGLLSVSWSESASRWNELIQFDFPAQLSRSLSGAEQEIAFDRRLIHLYVRVPRAGVLRLNADLVGGTGTVLGNNTLRIATDAGYARELNLSSKPMALEIPAPIGTTRIRLSLLEPVTQTNSAPKLKNVRWSFEPAPHR